MLACFPWGCACLAMMTAKIPSQTAIFTVCLWLAVPKLKTLRMTCFLVLSSGYKALSKKWILGVILGQRNIVSHKMSVQERWGALRHQTPAGLLVSKLLCIFIYEVYIMYTCRNQLLEEGNLHPSAPVGLQEETEEMLSLHSFSLEESVQARVPKVYLISWWRVLPPELDTEHQSLWLWVRTQNYPQSRHVWQLCPTHTMGRDWD